MKIRLVEEYRVQYDITRFAIERKSGWGKSWYLLNSYSKREDAKVVFDRYKKARGDDRVRNIIEEYSPDNQGEQR